MSEHQNAPPPPSRQDFADRAARNPFSNDLAVVHTVGALASAEGQRSVAEVQARMIIARANPRDPQKCMDAILRDCTRPSLAEKALYQYARGGSSISGPSIRLAEAIAQRWGNIASGIKEISRGGGYSECVAYAWDLETGYYDERQFQIRHWRDTKQGGHPLTDERDIYELIANMGQRRKRAVLLTVIPGDVVEAAEEQCEQTLKADVDLSPEALKRLAAAFAAYGVSQAQIEKRCQCRLEAVRPAQVVQLRKIYASLKDEMSEPKDWFETNAWTEVAEQHAGTRAQQQANAEQSKPKTTGKRQPKNTGAPAAAEQGTAASSEPDGTHPTSDPSGDGVPATGDATTALTFDEWLLDENGDPLGEESFGSSIVFATALEARWQSSDNREALLAQNADGVAAASADTIGARKIIDSMSNAAETAEETAIEALIVAINSDRGKPNLSQYLKDFRSAVSALGGANYLDFIAANRDTMMTTPMSTRSLCVKALVEHADKLGIARPPGLAEALQDKPQPAVSGTPSPSPDDAAYQRDLRSVEERIAEIKASPSVNELAAMGRGAILQSFGARLDREGKTVLKKMLADAYESRMKELGG